MKIVTNYAFDAEHRKITFSDFTTINLERILSITNLTRGVIMFDAEDVIFSPVSGLVRLGTVSGNILTLSYDTSIAMLASDKLRIEYDDNATVTDPGTAQTNVDTNLGAKADSVATTNTGSFSLIALIKRLLGHVDPTNAEQTGLSANALNADLVASTDVSTYKWFSIQILGSWSGTLTWQGSNDNSTWVNAIAMNVVGGSNSTATTTANGIFSGSINFRYLRIRMTSFVSGPATGVLQLFKTSPGFLNNSSIITAMVPGTGATSLGKAEDAVHASGDTGIFIVGVRDDGNTILTNADGDYAPVALDKYGRVKGGLIPTNTLLTPYAGHITTNTTTTPVAALCYISSIAINTVVGGTTSTITIKDKSGTPLTLVNALPTAVASTTPTVIDFGRPIQFTGGIDIVTAGAGAATVDVWIEYYT